MKERGDVRTHIFLFSNNPGLLPRETQTMKQHPLSRRTMLKSVGAATIGLPFLEEMLGSTAVAAPAARVRVRAFNVFFGLGIPSPLQTEGFAGVMEPLKPLGDKLLIMRGVDHVRCDEKGINAHYDGATAAFTAEPPDGEASVLPIELPGWQRLAGRDDHCNLKRHR